jgi:hypothetical protein
MPLLQLMERITALSDEQALEAVNLLGGITLGATPDDELRSQVVADIGTDAHTLQQRLNAARADHVAQFARVVLITHAVYRSADDVEQAIEQTGKKAFLLEAAVIGLIGFGILHLWLTKGQKSKTETTRIEIEPSGKVTITIENHVAYYSVGESLAPFLSAMLEQFLPQP